MLDISAIFKAMINFDNSDDKAFLEKTIHHLEATGFEDIKADFDGYETPKSFLKKGSETKITPDIVALKNGMKYFFEISLKSDNQVMLKSKWLFLDALTRLRSNRFRIVTTKGHYKFTDSMLEDINLTSHTPIKL